MIQKKNMKKENMKKVVVGLSGGVDSAVTAYLLKEQGYDVIGVTMQVWQEKTPDSEENTGIVAVDDARRIARQLGIPHYVLDFKDVFQKHVINYFIDSYNNGRTPNPCVRCNRYVKWEALLKKAKEFGAEYVATGHYANIKKLENGRLTIANAKSHSKDQTYALFRLTQEQLEHTIMPLGAYEKTTVREIAKKAGIIVAEKKDSQDMCFVPDGRYANFIWQQTGERAIPGNFVSEDGTVLGRHKGIIFYTVGQRKGLRLRLGKKTFVKEIRPETDEVVVSGADAIFTKELKAGKLNFMGVSHFDEPTKAFAKIRYSHSGGKCTVIQLNDDMIQCIFDEPQRAITPGQCIVVYDNDGNILCGGDII